MCVRVCVHMCVCIYSMCMCMYIRTYVHILYIYCMFLVHEQTASHNIPNTVQCVHSANIHTSTLRGPWLGVNVFRSSKTPGIQSYIIMWYILNITYRDISAAIAGIQSLHTPRGATCMLCPPPSNVGVRTHSEMLVST